MGGGASIPADNLTDEQKKELVQQLKAEYERASSAENKGDDLEIYRKLKAQIEDKIVKAGGTVAPTSPKGGRLSIGAQGAKKPDVDNDESAAAAAAAAAIGDQPTEEESNNKKSGKNFRKKRLTIARQRKAEKTDKKAIEDSNDRVYRSLEIGEDANRPPPFPVEKVGTFSCHGIEPSFDEFEGVSAKINQDRGMVVHPFNNKPTSAIFAVFDGHGEKGQLVSHFVMHEVNRQLEAHPTLESDTVKALKESFVATDQALGKDSNIDAFYSGTTAVMVLMRGKHLYVANAGDSRAVKYSTEKGAVNLSIDQNPNLPEEQARIEASGGFVSPPPEPGLSARVWLDPDMTQIGLAMARSIGDHAVKHVGVIAEPVVKEYDLAPNDEFLVLASDGVWEFVSSDEACNIVKAQLAAGKGSTVACQSLIEAAAERWREEEGDYRDDITAIVVKLPVLEG